MLEILPLIASGAHPRLPERLFPGVGQMHRQHQPPVVPVDRLPVFRRRLFGDVPQIAEVGIRRAGVPGRGDGQHRGAVFAGQRHAGGRLHRGYGDGHMRLGVGAQLQQRLPQREPVAFVADGLGFGHQPQHHPEALIHPLPLRRGVDAQHIGVAGQGAGADAQHHPPVGHMVQLHHAVGDIEGVVVGDADDAGAQLDVLGAVGGHADEDFRRGDGLPAGAVMLADPGLIEAQVVQPLHQFQVAVQGQGWIFAHPVERPHENPELHPFRQSHNANSSTKMPG